LLYRAEAKRRKEKEEEEARVLAKQKAHEAELRAEMANELLVEDKIDEEATWREERLAQNPALQEELCALEKYRMQLGDRLVQRGGAGGTAEQELAEITNEPLVDLAQGKAADVTGPSVKDGISLVQSTDSAKDGISGPAAATFARLVEQRIRFREKGNLGEHREQVLLLYRLHKEIISRWWRMESIKGFKADQAKEGLDQQWWAEGMRVKTKKAVEQNADPSRPFRELQADPEADEAGDGSSSGALDIAGHWMPCGERDSIRRARAKERRTVSAKCIKSLAQAQAVLLTCREHPKPITAPKSASASALASGVGPLIYERLSVGETETEASEHRTNIDSVAFDPWCRQLSLRGLIDGHGNVVDGQRHNYKRYEVLLRKEPEAASTGPTKGKKSKKKKKKDKKKDKKKKKRLTMKKKTKGSDSDDEDDPALNGEYEETQSRRIEDEEVDEGAGGAGGSDSESDDDDDDNENKPLLNPVYEETEAGGEDTAEQQSEDSQTEEEEEEEEEDSRKEEDEGNLSENLSESDGAEGSSGDDEELGRKSKKDKKKEKKKKKKEKKEKKRKKKLKKLQGMAQDGVDAEGMPMLSNKAPAAFCEKKYYSAGGDSSTPRVAPTFTAPNTTIADYSAEQTITTYGLGLCVKGGVLTVDMVAPHSVAAIDGTVRRGDILVNISGLTMDRILLPRALLLLEKPAVCLTFLRSTGGGKNKASGVKQTTAKADEEEESMVQKATRKTCRMLPDGTIEVGIQLLALHVANTFGTKSAERVLVRAVDGTGKELAVFPTPSLSRIPAADADENQEYKLAQRTKENLRLERLVGGAKEGPAMGGHDDDGVRQVVWKDATFYIKLGRGTSTCRLAEHHQEKHDEKFNAKKKKGMCPSLLKRTGMGTAAVTSTLDVSDEITGSLTLQLW
jgi:hypothetical protein